MASIGDIPEKTASAVNKPESGTYGEQADLQRLRAQLPSTGAASPLPQARPMPSFTERPVRAPMTSTAPAGLPQSILAPTQRPNEPMTTMPSQAPAPLAVNGQQRRLMKLDLLANSPDVSPETREFARMMLRVLVGGE